MSDIELLRQEIDLLDKEIISLFEKRMDIVSLIAENKLKENLDIFDAKREEAIISKNLSLVREDLRPYYKELIKKYIELSKEYQSKIIDK